MKKTHAVTVSHTTIYRMIVDTDSLSAWDKGHEKRSVHDRAILKAKAFEQGVEIVGDIWEAMIMVSLEVET